MRSCGAVRVRVFVRGAPRHLTPTSTAARRRTVDTLDDDGDPGLSSFAPLCNSFETPLQMFSVRCCFLRCVLVALTYDLKLDKVTGNQVINYVMM